MTTTNNISATRLLALTLAAAALCISCSEGDQANKLATETAVSGDLTLWVDEEIRPLMDSILIYHSRENPKARVRMQTMSATGIIHKMISRSERVAIVARDYTPEEDSLIASAELDTVARALVAKDALVFFVDKSFPYDTMNAEHIRQWLSGAPGPAASYPKLRKAPVFVVSGGSAGSVYGNITNVVLRGRQPATSVLATAATHSEVVQEVVKNPTLIGVGYLSQIRRDTSVKPLRLGYTAADGTHEWPKPVHPAYLMMGKYPFPVPIFAYVTSKPSQHDVAFGFMQFATRSNKAQYSLFNAGIEPAHAKITLYLPEE
jgi:ABC-type phosphate transport system substrate-binding protein